MDIKKKKEIQTNIIKMNRILLNMWHLKVIWPKDGHIVDTGFALYGGNFIVYCTILKIISSLYLPTVYIEIMIKNTS